jgi:hypothetical protein
VLFYVLRVESLEFETRFCSSYLSVAKVKINNLDHILEYSVEKSSQGLACCVSGQLSASITREQSQKKTRKKVCKLSVSQKVIFRF